MTTPTQPTAPGQLHLFAEDEERSRRARLATLLAPLGRREVKRFLAGLDQAPLTADGLQFIAETLLEHTAHLRAARDRALAQAEQAVAEGASLRRIATWAAAGVDEVEKLLAAPTGVTGAATRRQGELREALRLAREDVDGRERRRLEARAEVLERSRPDLEALGRTFATLAASQVAVAREYREASGGGPRRFEVTVVGGTEDGTVPGLLHSRPVTDNLTLDDDALDESSFGGK